MSDVDVMILDDVLCPRSEHMVIKMKKRFCYALIDSIIGYDLLGYQGGLTHKIDSLAFAVAFRSREERADYLSERRSGVRAITRDDAEKMVEDCDQHGKGTFVLFWRNLSGKKGIEILERYWDTRGRGEPKICWMLASDAAAHKLKPVESE